jgi:hypothetical protein
MKIARPVVAFVTGPPPLEDPPVVFDDPPHAVNPTPRQGRFSRGFDSSAG